MWDHLHALKIQFLELSLVLGCILLIKLAGATNRACELSRARACALVRDHSRLIERPGITIYIENALLLYFLYAFVKFLLCYFQNIGKLFLRFDQKEKQRSNINNNEKCLHYHMLLL